MKWRQDSSFCTLRGVSFKYRLLALLLGARSSYRDSWHRYERSDRTLRFGLLAVRTEPCSLITALNANLPPVTRSGGAGAGPVVPFVGRWIDRVETGLRKGA